MVGGMPSLDSTQLTYTLTSRGRFQEVHEFENIIIRSNSDGSALRLKDVAKVEVGAELYNFEASLNGKAVTMMAVFTQPGANIVGVANSLVDVLDEISERFPDGMTHKVTLDTSNFIRVSIKSVIQTLFEAFALVFIVVLIFLHNWRATLIPMLAVPVSIIGTFAGLYLFGFSINMFTLFALVLASGIVVDDAIVVLENIERILEEEDISVLDAAFKAMTEVTGPIVAIVLVLTAVFLPVAFLGGLSGQWYRHFAVSIGISGAFSTVVAL
jgi:multidrug efflux pump subunit AcrB